MAMTIKEISEAMRDIDICMLTTYSDNGRLAARPMSNNRDVDYDGDSYFFAHGDSHVVQELAAEPKANLSLSHSSWLSKNFYLSIMARAELIRDRAQMEDHWNKDLEIWFSDGLDTPGITMIKLHAETLRYWHGGDQGELRV